MIAESALATIAEDADTAPVIRSAVESAPAIVHATEMLFTAMAMSARANWRSHTI